MKISIQSGLFCEPQGETKVFKESTDVIKFAFGKAAEECGRMPWGKTKGPEGGGLLSESLEKKQLSPFC